MSGKTILIFAEKSSVAGDLARALLGVKNPPKVGDYFEGELNGDKLRFMPAVGHLMTLVGPDEYNPEYKSWYLDSLPFNIPDWKFKMRPLDKVASRVQDFKKFLKTMPKGSEIVNCGDAGREGELIFRELFDYLVPGGGQFVWSRMWLQSMTSSAIRECFEKREPLSKYDCVSRAAYGRAAADWYVGLSMTRLFSKGAPEGLFKDEATGKPLSKRCGRVKSPVLGFVAARDALIENFIPERIFSVRGYFPSLVGGKKEFVLADLDPFLGEKKPEILGNSKIDPLDARKNFWNREKAERFAKECVLGGSDYKVSDVLSPSKAKAPLGYDLTSAQKDAFNRFGYPAKMTLDVLQELYEKYKVLTYPRVDYKCFPEDYKATLVGALKSAVKFFPEFDGVEFLPDAKMYSSKVFDNSGVGDHFALAPTSSVGAVPSLSGAHLNIYKMVLQRCLQAVDEAAVYDKVVRTWVKAKQQNELYWPLRFSAESKILRIPGWRRWGGVEADEDDAVAFSPVSGDFESALKVDVQESETKPPKHFNEATLLAAMENASRFVSTSALRDDLGVDELQHTLALKGLGTPATRASIITECFSDAYFFRSGSGKSAIIKIAPRGKQLYGELLERVPFLLNPAVTAEWEHALLLMEKGDPAALSFEAWMDLMKSIVVGALESFKKVGFVPGAFKGTYAKKEAVASDEVCPKTGEPLQDFGDYWKFPYKPWNIFKCNKVFIHRPMTVGDWVKVLEGIDSGDFFTLDNLKAKSGKLFSAKIIRKDDPKFGVGFGFSFD